MLTIQRAIQINVAMLNHVTMSQARGANFNIFKERHEAEFMSDLAPVVKVKTSPLAVLEVKQILENPPRDKLSEVPPCSPKGGEMFLYFFAAMHSYSYGYHDCIITLFITSFSNLMQLIIWDAATAGYNTWLYS